MKNVHSAARTRSVQKAARTRSVRLAATLHQQARKVCTRTHTMHAHACMHSLAHSCRAFVNIPSICRNAVYDCRMHAHACHNLQITVGYRAKTAPDGGWFSPPLPLMIHASMRFTSVRRLCACSCCNAHVHGMKLIRLGQLMDGCARRRETTACRHRHQEFARYDHHASRRASRYSSLQSLAYSSCSYGRLICSPDP